MSKNIILCTIPSMLIPYFTLFTLALIFFSTKVSAFEWIMEKVFHNNALYLIGVLFLFIIFSAIFSIICFVRSIRKEYDGFSLTKIALIVKLIQSPAYIIIFILGLLFGITIFTIPFSIGLFLVDCMSLSLTSLFALSGIINSSKKSDFKSPEVILHAASQFIFCIDVISLFIFYKKLKRGKK